MNPTPIPESDASIKVRIEACADVMTDPQAEIKRLRADLRVSESERKRLAREIDVAMHGEAGAAKQAALCDLVPLALALRRKADAGERLATALESLAGYVSVNIGGSSRSKRKLAEASAAIDGFREACK